MKNYLALCLLPIVLYSAPSHPEIKHGKASFQGNKIEASDKAIIHWKDFSIEAGEMVQFVQPNSKSVVLNRVVGGKMSQLMGSLEANGHVYLINPQGIVIGKDAVINTAGFTASALDLLDDDFLRGKDVLFKGDSHAPVTNIGMIIALDGDATLIGYQVANEGSMIAPEGTVALAAGLEVILKPNSEDHIFIRPSTEERINKTGALQSGIIDAVKAEIKADGNLYSVAICHEGKTQATALKQSDGKIFLVAEGGRADVGGTLEARSGTIHVLAKVIDILDTAAVDVSGSDGGGTLWVGGDPQGRREDVYHADFLRVNQGATLKADGLESANGGEIVMFSEHTALFYGEASAEGGIDGGDGGFIEFSGKQYFDFQQGQISTDAPAGKRGTFLLDPNAITIGAVATSPAITPPPPYGPLLPEDPNWPGNVFPLTNTAAGTLQNTDLQTCLAKSNVQVSSIGDIVVNGAISWATASDLYLDATSGGSVINIGGTITCTGGGSLIVNADSNIIVGAALSITGVPHLSGMLSAPVPSINITSANGFIQTTAPILVTTGFGNINMTTTNGSAGAGLITIGANVGCKQGGYIIITSTNDGLTLNTIGGDVEIFTPGGQPFGTGYGINIKTGDNIILNSLAGTHHAQIGCNNDTLALTSIDCNILIDCEAFSQTNPLSITLNGGSSPNAYSQIGHRGGASTSPLTINGSVFVGGASNGTTISLQSGSAAGSYTQIGHSPNTSAMPTTIQTAGILAFAPYEVSSTGNFAVNLTGGSANSTYALIGNGGIPTAGGGALVTYDGQYFNPNFDPAILANPNMRFSPNTMITIETSTLTLQGGNGTNSFAAVGVAGVANTTFAKPYRVYCVANGADPTGITLQAGTALGANANAGAHIGIFLEAANATSLSSPVLHDVEIFTAGLNSGAISLTTPSGSSIAAIGTGTNLGGATIGCNIDISTLTGTTGADISLTPTTANAFIQTGIGSFPKAYINMSTNTNINLTSSPTASAFITSQGDALLLAGLDVVMVGDPVNLATISSTNNLMIVTDNAAFGSGPGGFKFDANSRLISGGGIPIYIWTAVQGQNTTNGLFNGQPFGSIFTESGITWHQGFTVNPFAALFYK